MIVLILSKLVIAADPVCSMQCSAICYLHVPILLELSSMSAMAADMLKQLFSCQHFDDQDPRHLHMTQAMLNSTLSALWVRRLLHLQYHLLRL